MSAPEPRRERRHVVDRTAVDVALVVRVGAALVAVIAVVVITVFAWHRTAFDRPTTPRAIAVAPGMPTLQVDAGGDRAAYDADKAALLRRYEWIDRERGVVRIPIDRAMERLSSPKEPAR